MVRLKDNEAMEKYIQAFNTNIPELNDYAYWEKLRNSTEWMKKTYPDSPFTEVADRYENALLLIACIRHEVIQERGEHIDKCRETIR